MKTGLTSGRGNTLEGRNPKRVTGSRQFKPLAAATDSRVEQSLGSEGRSVGFTLWSLCLVWRRSSGFATFLSLDREVDRAYRKLGGQRHRERCTAAREGEHSVGGTP